MMNNQELYSVMVQITWTLKTRALTKMQVRWRQVASVPVGGDPPLSDGRGTQSGDFLCEQKWRLPACVADGPSSSLKAVPKNGLQANRAGIRRHCTGSLHAAEHTAMRTAIYLTGDSKQGGVRLGKAEAK